MSLAKQTGTARVKKVKEALKLLNIAKPSTPVYNSALLILYLYSTRCRIEWVMAKRLGLPLEEVNQILDRLKKYEIYVNMEIDLEPWETDTEMLVSITLAAMCGAGEIVRYKHQYGDNDLVPEPFNSEPQPTLPRPVIGGKLPPSKKPDQLKFPYIPR